MIAIDEELQSATEELQGSQDALHSTNEELNTVNALTPADVGLPIAQATARLFGTLDAAAHARRVLREVAPFLLPYRRPVGAAEGVVVTFSVLPPPGPSEPCRPPAEAGYASPGGGRNVSRRL